MLAVTHEPHLSWPMDVGTVVLVSVGNTRTRFALLRGGEVEPSTVVVNEDVAAVARAIEGATGGEAGIKVVMATVNAPIAERLASELRGVGVDVLRFGV